MRQQQKPEANQRSPALATCGSPAYSTASMAEACIATKTLVYDGWYKLYRIGVDMPDGSHVERHINDYASSVAVLPYDPVRKTCLLVSQPRVPVLETQAPALLGVIAGNLDGARPEEQIRKEALEEAGLQLSDLEPVTNIWSWAPVSTERIQLYVARYGQADRIGDGGGGEDENECIVVHEIGLDALRDLVLSRELHDAKTIILAQHLMLRHPELWSEAG